MLRKVKKMMKRKMKIIRVGIGMDFFGQEFLMAIIPSSWHRK
jgi:hypothetical protein